MLKLEFGKIVSVIDTEDNKPKYAEQNFCGKYSFSNPQLCDKIFRYITSNYKFKTHVDIGGSIGRLSYKLQESGIDSWVIDGSTYGWDRESLLVSKSRYCVADLTQPLDIEDKFDLATCFEVTEHVPESGINQFIENCKQLSDRLICTVHFGGVETANHINIKPLQWWFELFSEYGTVTVLDFAISQEFLHSEFLLVEFND